MPCYHPLDAWREPDGKVTVAKHRHYAEAEYMQLPCGSCIGCRKRLANDWQIRCQLETQKHTRQSWATLTYATRYLPLTLRPDHLSGFIKRLRDRVAPLRVRHYGTGEYGEQNHRPHYHVILWGIPKTKATQTLVDQCWPQGITRVDTLTPAAIAYVAGYMQKKIGWKDKHKEQIDYTTGELYQWQPEFRQMSTNPGIAEHAKQYWTDWRTTAIVNGQERPAPRYLRNAWKKQATAKQIRELEEELRQWHKNQQERDPRQQYEKLHAAEVIANARATSNRSL